MSLTKQDKQDIQEIVDVTVNKVVNKAVDDLSEIIAGFATQVDERFDKLETRIDVIELRLANLELRMDQRFSKLLDTVDGFIKRLDESEVESAARDAQFERLLEWAREVSAKTGIPLKNL